MVRSNIVPILLIVGLAAVVFLFFASGTPAEKAEPSMTITIYDAAGNIIHVDEYSVVESPVEELSQSFFGVERGEIKEFRQSTIDAIRSPEAARAVVTFTVQNTGDLPLNFRVSDSQFIGVQSVP